MKIELFEDLEPLKPPKVYIKNHKVRFREVAQV